jgi:hypothetical protein
LLGLLRLLGTEVLRNAPGCLLRLRSTKVLRHAPGWHESAAEIPAGTETARLQDLLHRRRILAQHPAAATAPTKASHHAAHWGAEHRTAWTSERGPVHRVEHPAPTAVHRPKIRLATPKWLQATPVATGRHVGIARSHAAQDAAGGGWLRRRQSATEWWTLLRLSTLQEVLQVLGTPAPWGLLIHPLLQPGTPREPLLPLPLLRGLLKRATLPRTESEP